MAYGRKRNRTLHTLDANIRALTSKIHSTTRDLYNQLNNIPNEDWRAELLESFEGGNYIPLRRIARLESDILYYRRLGNCEKYSKKCTCCCLKCIGFTLAALAIALICSTMGARSSAIHIPPESITITESKEENTRILTADRLTSFLPIIAHLRELNTRLLNLDEKKYFLLLKENILTNLAKDREAKEIKPPKPNIPIQSEVIFSPLMNHLSLFLNTSERAKMSCANHFFKYQLYKTPLVGAQFVLSQKHRIQFSLTNTKRTPTFGLIAESKPAFIPGIAKYRPR